MNGGRRWCAPGAWMDRHRTLEDHGQVRSASKRVGLYVDEWGTWYDVEPGSNPGFLYQQNTLRDAVVAAINLNIFHAHADRVHMTNIAQMVNVLQAMILTDKDRMLLTPTYHVFHMYKPFRGATHLPVGARGAATQDGRDQRAHPHRLRGARHATANCTSRWSISIRAKPSPAPSGSRAPSEEILGHHPHGRRNGRAQHLRQARER